MPSAKLTSPSGAATAGGAEGPVYKASAGRAESPCGQEASHAVPVNPLSLDEEGTSDNAGGGIYSELALAPHMSSVTTAGWTASPRG